MKKFITVIAVFVTLTAIGMTAVAALERGATMLDKILLVSLSVVIILAVHLIPALSRRPIAWVIWAGCLLCAIYGHLTFLTYASLRAGEVRAQQSAMTVGTERQIDTVREALSEIKARPVSVVAAELAQEHSRRVRAALSTELTEGRRAETLRDELTRLEAVSTTARVTGTGDPVTARIAAVTGVTEGTVTVVIGMTFSLLLEVVGALLWYEALKPVPAVVTEKVTVTPESNAVTHPVTPVVTLPLNQAVETEGVTAAVTGATDAGTVLSNAGTTPVTPPVTHVTPLFNQDVSAFETDSVTPVTGISNVLSNAGTGTVTPVTQPGTAPVTHVTQNAIDEFAKLTEAVKVGACKSTVSGIRGFLACGQTRAVELRRALVEAGAVA